VTSAELAREVFSIVERKLSSERRSMEFEMAYEMRVVADKIRFAVRAPDSIGPLSASEVSLQLLEALDLLEGLDRRFRRRCPSALDHP
jgi:hypothetical protein